MTGVVERKKGVALFLVLATFAIVVALVIAMLNLMLSHSRITQHQVGRIQAYYAAMGGINVAFEKLRTGVWYYDAAKNTNSCPQSTPCQINDNDFSYNIQNKTVNIVFCPKGSFCTGAYGACLPPPGSDFCIFSTVDYITREAGSPPQ